MFNANGAFSIKTAEDMLSVRFELSDNWTETEITRENIIRALEDRHIVYTPEDVKRIDRAVAAIRSEGKPEEEPLIVMGEEPVHGVDGRVIDCLDPNERARTKGGGTDHYKRNTLRAVDPGDLVLKFIRPTPHTDGRDVYGREVPAIQGEMPQVTLSDHLETSEDGLEVRAKSSGTFDFEDGVATLTPNLQISGDIDFRTGSVDFEGEVDIAKDVADRFHIKTSKNVTIRGIADGAQIEALLNVSITGGIYGKGKGFYKAGKEFFARFASEAQIVAAEDITFDEFCQNSDIRCGGKFIMPNGVLRGGELRCKKGADIGELGAEGASKTLIWVGVHENLPEQLIYVDEQIKGLMSRIKELKAEYEEKIAKTDPSDAAAAAKITSIAESIQKAIAQLKERRDTMHQMREDQENNDHVGVNVTRCIYPGVIVHFYGAFATFREKIEGPHSISVERSEEGTRILLTSLQTNEQREIPAEPYFPESPGETQEAA